MENPAPEFITKYGFYVLGFLFLLSIAAFFFAKPANLVTQKCILSGFDCERMAVSLEKSLLLLTLENHLGKGVMVKSLTSSSPDFGLKCDSSFDQGWGPFVFGIHISPGGSEKIEVHCSGIEKNLVNAGNVRLDSRIEWFFDDSSEAQTNITIGQIYARVGP